MKNLQKCLIPTSTITSSTSKYIGNNAQCAFLANGLLKTSSLKQENIREWAILHSGAMSHFLVISALCDDVRPALTPLTVCHPDGAQVQSLHTCSLHVDNLPQNVRIAHVIPGLALHSLLSVV